MARQSKKPDLYKEVWKRTQRDTVRERDLGYGRLIDYYHNHKVELFWGYNEDMQRDQFFRLRLTDNGKSTEVILDAEEFTKFLRWV